MTDIRDQAVRLYDAYTHEHLDRRRLLREMTAVAGSVAAAELLIAGIGASAASAAVVAPDDKRLVMLKGVQTLPTGKQVRGYWATPAMRPGRANTRGSVMVVHENRGLNAHIEDVARRVALAGFSAFAPDFLTDQGGTPADADAARAMFAKADLAALTALGVQIAAMLASMGGVRRKVGAVGFCWGGAFVNRLAVAAGPKLSAGVSYYGSAPAPAEATKISAPLMLHLAGEDARVNATALPWAEALRAAGKRVEAFTYPGVDHAFNNDSSAERYDKAAAELAWGRSVAFLRRELDA